MFNRVGMLVVFVFVFCFLFFFAFAMFQVLTKELLCVVLHLAFTGHCIISIIVSLLLMKRLRNYSHPIPQRNISQDSL